MPGADMAIVTKVTLARGRRAALFTTLGINAGAFTWSLMAATGVAALVAASSVAFSVLKLGGAAYLIYLGILALWDNRVTPAKKASDDQPGNGEQRWAGSPFQQGMMTNLLNPKIGIFYTSFLPQFVTAGDSVFWKFVLLGAIHNVLGFFWWVFYAGAVAKIQSVLRRPVVEQILGLGIGLVLCALGVGLGLATSPQI